MKELRFIHTADLHLSAEPKKKEKAELSLKQILQYCENVKVNAVIIAGDVFDKKQTYSSNSAVPIALKFFHKLSKLVDFVFITAGNASHDEPGSIELLHQIEPNVYAYEYPVVLAVRNNNVIDSKADSQVKDILRYTGEPLRYIDYIVSLVPYPTKASLLIEDSIDNNNANFIEKFEQIFEHIGEVTQPYTCPKLLAFHGNVVGSRLSSGQTLVSQDIMVAPSTLQKAMHHYYALGHIHCRQEVFMNGVYSGSIYNKNWGETEQKSFEVIDITQYPDLSDPTFELHKQTISLTAARPMIKMEATFEDGEFLFDEDYPAIDKGCEYRLRVSVKENDRKLITDDKISELKNIFGDDVKIEFNIIPDQRESRSEKIMTCKTLLDEVTEYATVIDADVFSTGTEENFIKPSLQTKVLELQEKGVEV